MLHVLKKTFVSVIKHAIAAKWRHLIAANGLFKTAATSFWHWFESVTNAYPEGHLTLPPSPMTYLGGAEKKEKKDFILLIHEYKVLEIFKVRDKESRQRIAGFCLF